MRFSFSDEQEQFRSAVQRFLQDKSNTREVRRLMETDSGFDQAVWRQLCTELGLVGIHVPEAYGGLGFGHVELGVVLEEMGRALFCAPYFSSAVLAASAISNHASEANKHALLPAICAGTSRATLAVTEANGRWDSEGIALVAAETDGGFSLSGQKSFVLDGHNADLVIVVARQAQTRGDDGLAFFIVKGDAAGLRRRALQTIDQTRKLAVLDFDDVHAELLGNRASAAAALRQTLDQAAIALANEMVGGAQALLDSAVAYAEIRMQFGRVIGSFQAIKHKCAELLLDVELAKSAAYYAAAALDENDAEAPALAALAKACASDTYMRAAAECIQIHGGIGFTWDQDTHLWYKRAKSSEVFLGDPSYHRERYMQHLEECA